MEKLFNHQMGYILDTFREKRIDIKNLVEGQVLAHKTKDIWNIWKNCMN